jgi:hypothetical protein
LFSLQVFAGRRADSRDTKPKDDAEAVELFDGMRSGDLEVRVIAKDATTGNVLIKNTTKKPLKIKLPEAFAAVPVAAQFGGPFGGMPIGGNPFGGGMMNGGLGMNNGMPGVNGMMTGGGANQALGAGFPGMNGGNIGNNRPGGGGPGLGMPFNGGVFKVEPEKVGKLKMTSVCLEHGKPDPNSRIEYEIRPLDSITNNQQTIEAVRMLARGEVDQKSAQAAAWHLANGLTWEEMQRKIGRKHLDGRVEMLFSPDQLKLAQQIVAEAKVRADKQPKMDDHSDSLAQQQ